MNAGETSDQIVKMTLQGIEVAASVTAKIGGTAAKSLAAMLYAILTDKKKVKGKARLQTMLKSGKELKVFAIRHEDLKLFCDEAKHYGVLYSVLKEKNNTDGICDIMVRAEDAAKISRIVDKFELATIDTKAIKEAILNERTQKDSSVKDIPVMSEEEHDSVVHSLLNSIKPSSLDENPSQAPTKKSPQSEPTLKEPKRDVGACERKSVKVEIAEIKEEQHKKTSDKKLEQSKIPLQNKKLKSKKKMKEK